MHRLGSSWLLEEARHTKNLTIEYPVERLPKALFSASPSEEEERRSDVPPLLHELKGLELRFCRLQDECFSSASFGSAGGECPLQKLNLSYNLLTALPPGVETLTCLKMLVLNNNNLTHVPASLLALANLESLVLYGNMISSLPKQFWSSFPRLQYLNLSYNMLEELPATFFELPNTLQALHLSDNRISSISPPNKSYSAASSSCSSSCSSSSSELRVLNFSHNQLKALPKELFERFTALKLLYLDHNELAELPSTLSLLSRLELLRIDSNRLQTLTATTTPTGQKKNDGTNTYHPLSGLHSLIALELDNNNLTDLPQDIHDLWQRHHLRVLRIANNKALTENSAASTSETQLQKKIPEKQASSSVDLLSAMLAVFKCDEEEKAKQMEDEKEEKDVQRQKIGEHNWFHLLVMDEELRKCLSYVLPSSSSSSCSSSINWPPPLSLSLLIEGMDHLPTASFLNEFPAPTRPASRLLHLSNDAITSVNNLRSLSALLSNATNDDEDYGIQHGTVIHMPVYRQWDGASCGYHALKNAVMGLMAAQHCLDEQMEREELLRLLFQLMANPIYFWVLFFHWQEVLLNVSKQKHEEAARHSRKVDIVWSEKNIKSGIMERNYVLSLLKQDDILLELGTEKLVVIADLDYVQSDPLGSAQVLRLHKQMCAFRNGDAKAMAFLIGLTKTHWVTVIALRTAEKGSGLFLVADSRDLEQDNEGEASEGNKQKALHPNIALIIDCLEGNRDFHSFYLDAIMKGYLQDSRFMLLDMDTSAVQAERIMDWYEMSSSFFSSFSEKMGDFRRSSSASAAARSRRRGGGTKTKRQKRGTTTQVVMEETEEALTTFFAQLRATKEEALHTLLETVVHESNNPFLKQCYKNATQ
ncbi:hypothetical protein QOT17_006108 [Balamuthia mandrillaris]